LYICFMKVIHTSYGCGCGGKKPVPPVKK